MKTPFLRASSSCWCPSSPSISHLFSKVHGCLFRQDAPKSNGRALLQDYLSLQIPMLLFWLWQAWSKERERASVARKPVASFIFPTDVVQRPRTLVPQHFLCSYSLNAKAPEGEKMKTLVHGTYLPLPTPCKTENVEKIRLTFSLFSKGPISTLKDQDYQVLICLHKDCLLRLLN